MRQSKKIKIKLLFMLLCFISVFSSKVAFAETYDGVRNIEKEMIIEPRGNPTKTKEMENRLKEFTSFESTGLFLYQGEELEIDVKDEPEKLEVRIGQWGGYNDVPYILNGTQTKPFTNGIFSLHKGINRVKRDESGGMVYLVNYSETRPENVTIKGGVKVPHYIEGITSTNDFETQLETYKDVPFMEMENDNVIATIRIDRAKDIFLKKGQEKVFIDTVKKVKMLSDHVAGLADDSFGVAKKSKQRIHIVNPSFGAGTLFATNYFVGLHSKTTKDRIIFASDGDTPDWGLSHEIGHIYQDNSYLWKNMKEVTVNIYADYAQKNWNSEGTGRYDAVNVSNGSRESVANYFNKLSEDPTWTFDRETLESSDYHFAVLGLYMTLPRVFGYDFYSVLSQNYRSLPENEKPKTDLEKKQMFILMTSKVAERNLLPFFDYWRFTVTDETREEMSDLNLQPLEKDIWKDILASEEDEQNGTYRISDSVGPYTVPTGDLYENASIPFEEIQKLSSYDSVFRKLYSTPIESEASLIAVSTNSFSESFDFTNNAIISVYLKNALEIQNKLDISVKITPGNSYVMAGQRGNYAAVGYDEKNKKLVALGNEKRILENLPDNKYPDIKIYNKTMDTVKKEVVGYGSSKGTDIAKELNNFPVEIGDIIELTHKEASKRVNRYKDGLLLPTTKDTYYYRIQENNWLEVDDPHNQTSLKTANSTIKVGDNWNPEDNFVSATDKEGKEVSFTEVKVEGSVDTSKAGEYTVTYSYGSMSQEAVITVKEADIENQTSIKTTNSTITVGETWNPEDNFVSATDKEGKEVAYTEINV
ncbi:M60 family metallopeptidase, partial [Enterococcus caccae]